MSSRTILITGITSGLGQALLEPLSAAGHTLIGCGRNEETIVQLRCHYPSPHRFDVIDVSDAAAVADWAASLITAGQIPELLINNAGVINSNAPLWQVKAEELSKVMRVNVEGTANLLRSFVPAMIDRGQGVIVNFSSGWGRSTSAEVAPYCASKWAIEGLTQALAQELPSGLAAVAVNPGIIDTPMLRQCWGDGAGQFSTPTQWAITAAPFLLALTSKNNGQSLTIS